MLGWLSVVRSRWTPWIIALILGLIVVALYKSNANKAAEITRLGNNQEALLSEIETVRGKYGIEAAKVRALELSKREFENLYATQLDVVKSLNLKIKRLESVVQTSTSVEDSIVIEVDKPVLVRDTTPILRNFSFSDNWLTLDGRLVLSSPSSLGEARLDIKYKLVDTLDVIIYRTPKKFLFIKYGIKRLDCYISSKNPKSKVVMGSCVIVKK